MSPAEGRRRSLGRGLDSLLGAAPSAAAPEGGTESPPTLPVEYLRANPFQPRKNFDPEEMESLTQSVRENGILQPILVRPASGQVNAYEIIAGERRWRAAQQAKLHDVPVLIREITDSQALEIALVENLQRQDLSPLEEAEGFRRLMEEFEHTQEELARILGKSRSHVANMIRLLGLPEKVKAMLERAELSAGHARALLNAPDPEALAQQVVRRGLTVRQTERLSQAARTPARPAAGSQRPGKSVDTIALERELSNLLGLRVSIVERASGGDLVIHYTSLEQLDDVVERLGRKDRG